MFIFTLWAQPVPSRKHVPTPKSERFLLCRLRALFSLTCKSPVCGPLQIYECPRWGVGTKAQPSVCVSPSIPAPSVGGLAPPRPPAGRRCAFGENRWAARARACVGVCFLVLQRWASALAPTHGLLRGEPSRSGLRLQRPFSRSFHVCVRGLGPARPIGRERPQGPWLSERLIYRSHWRDLTSAQYLLFRGRSRD